MRRLQHFLIWPLLVALMLGCGQRKSPEKKQELQMNERETLRLGPRLRRLLRTAPEGTQVDLLIRCRREITDSLRMYLERQGFRLGTATGRLLTASGPLPAVKQLAQSAEIEYVELSPQTKPATQ